MCMQSDSEAFDIIPNEKKNYVASSTERAHHKDQYKVVQRFQGGGSDTVKTEEQPEYNQILQK